RRWARAHPRLPEGSALSNVAEKVCSETVSYLRTQQKSRIAELRASLSEDERMLLSLRLDRGLPWNDLARVLYDGPEEPVNDETLRRTSAGLRKRSKAIKEKLAELARREGLLGSKAVRQPK